MKKIEIHFLLIAIIFSFSLKAQIKKVIVETYYIADTLDATDTTQGRSLEPGSKTYRIYVALRPGYKIKKIYGTANHPLKISSTQNFYNNIDRPTAYFGYLINRSWFSSNPLLALDSWLTIGLATKIHSGVLKPEDTNGSIIGGPLNSGGTASVPGGLLVNNDANAGIPLTTSDGFLPFTNTLSPWIDNGFRNAISGGIDTTVFGSLNTGSLFYSTSAYLQQNTGIGGGNADSNKVLVAQLTTKGDIAFELNLQLLDSLGTSINCVASANGTTPSGDTIIVSSLKYPAECGCTDPNFLEYSSAYSCGNSDSCRTLIVFGCMDTMACNYNPRANFNIHYLCCYPGYCYNRDINVVCPNINNETSFELYPNPAQNFITLNITTIDIENVQYEIYDSFGAIKIQKNLGVFSGTISEQLDISSLPFGLYLVRVYNGNSYQSKIFTKN
jgi:hypothetical protein